MSQVVKRFLSFIGKVTLSDVATQGGAKWETAIPTAVKRFEEKDPGIKKVKIKGAKPHRSHKDPSDDKLVISVQLLNEREQRVTTIHVHEDGTSSEKP